MPNTVTVRRPDSFCIEFEIVKAIATTDNKNIEWRKSGIRCLCSKNSITFASRKAKTTPISMVITNEKMIVDWASSASVDIAAWNTLLREKNRFISYIVLHYAKICITRKNLTGRDIHL